MHLDWNVDDMEVEATRLESLGARRVAGCDRAPVSHVAMQDPEGNEFCIEETIDPEFTLPT